MPPRWPRQPNRRDPAYRRLEDRMNFAVHVAAFGACNSTLWFFQQVQTEVWPWIIWLTGGWVAILLAHGVYIFAVADYSQPSTLTTHLDSTNAVDASTEPINR